jgi:cytochrome c553
MEMKYWLRAILAVAIVAGAIGAMASGGGEAKEGGTVSADDDDDSDRTGERGRRAALGDANPQWRTECGSCHVAYPPRMLPAASWRLMMAGLDQHFGEDASLDAPTAATITEFLVRESGDAKKEAPASMRITDTRRFRSEHDEVGDDVWTRPQIGSRANCAACHRGAEEGDYSERRIEIPR